MLIESMEMLTMTDTGITGYRALKSGALVCYGYGHENNYIRGRRYKIVEIDVDE